MTYIQKRCMSWQWGPQTSKKFVLKLRKGVQGPPKLRAGVSTRRKPWAATCKLFWRPAILGAEPSAAASVTGVGLPGAGRGRSSWKELLKGRGLPASVGTWAGPRLLQVWWVPRPPAGVSGGQGAGFRQRGLVFCKPSWNRVKVTICLR